MGLKYSWVLAVLCALLLTYGVFMQFQYIDLQSDCKNQIHGLTTEISTLNSKLNSTLNSLEDTSAVLNQTQLELDSKIIILKFTQDKLEQTKQNLSQTKTQLIDTQSKVETIKEDVNELQRNLNDSMSWFKQNSVLDPNYSWDVDIFLKRIESDCIYENTLNLACINYLNGRTVLRLNYLSDLDAGEFDHLQSLERTIKRHGGDCEDYSLFFKAILQSLKSEDDLYLKGWEDWDSSRYHIWPQVDNPEFYVYYEDATAHTFANLKESIPYVMCYTSNSNSGHCRIALSQNEINSSSIQTLNGAQVFEPQNGKYAGVVGENYFICAQTQQECYSTPGAITLLITQDDIIQITNSNWVSYNDYLLQTRQISAVLN